MLNPGPPTLAAGLIGAEPMSDLAWLHAALISARPQAMSALLRHFRDIELAEEAFQEASLRALRNWPEKGPPRDAAAWLIFVGRNAAVDMLRRTRRETALPPEETLFRNRRCRNGDGRAARRRGLSRRHPAADVHLLPSRSAGDAAGGARACASSPGSRSARSPAPSWSAKAPWSSASPGPRRASARAASVSKRRAPVERAERLGAVAAMLYLLFNEGYTAGSRRARTPGPALSGGGHPPGAPAGAAVPGRAGDPGFAGADAAAAIAAARPFRCAGPGRRPRGSGPFALGPRGDRRGAGAGRQGAAPRAAGSLSAAGGDRGPACPRRAGAG